MEVYGLREEIDIYFFNLLTFYIMNECRDFYPLPKEIKEKEYGLFNNKDGIKICNTFFLDDRVPNKDFLIDVVDETNLNI